LNAFSQPSCNSFDGELTSGVKKTEAKQVPPKSPVKRTVTNNAENKDLQEIGIDLDQ